MEGGEIPSYVLPLFFTTQTQVIFKCVVDEDVSEQSPNKLINKNDILQDFKDRAAISDFHPAKKIVQNWPSDELLVVYDHAFQYGQNFYLITAEEQKEIFLNPVRSEAQEETGINGEENEVQKETIVVLRPGARTPKQWISLGSEQEVVDEMTFTRDKLSLTIARKRCEFGAPINLTDRDESDPKAAVSIDCLSYEEDSFIVHKKELDKSVQHAEEVSHIATQTKWPCPRNVNVQYSPRTNPDSINTQCMLSHGMSDFFQNVTPYIELALQQNATLDIFTNDYKNLGEDDESFISKPDHHLKEYQSFTDLQFSKNKAISHVQWHPTIKGLIAVSCMEKLTFYERVDSSSERLMTKSLLLIWSFANPIHPLLMLQGPDDIICFQFNPLDPDIICGGCINGQVVLWDVSEHSDRLRNHGTHGQSRNVNQSIGISSFKIDKTELSPIVRYCALSSIEYSHRSSITDIMWIPDHIEIRGMGSVYENNSKRCTQIMSCSHDGFVLIWDTKVPKSFVSSATPDVASRHEANMFKHLDLTWRPVHRVTVRRIKGKYSLKTFSISATQSAVKTSSAEKLKTEDIEEDQEAFSQTHVQKKEETKQLEHIDTKFYVGTEDGEIVYMDWKSRKDVNTGDVISADPEFVLDAHESSICSLQKSPFIKDIFLTVGGWRFSVWKHGVKFGPILKSGIHECKLSSGSWSPTRPGVFFIGRDDGNVDVWDLLDKSYEPFLSQNVSAVPLISVSPRSISTRQQLLAAGDGLGTLHVMEIPWALRHSSSNELNIIESYFEREANRLQFLESRASKPATTTVNITQLTLPEPVEEVDEQWEIKAKAQYEEYLSLEKYWLNELGLLSIEI